MYFSIIFKTLFMYFFIIVVYRIMGKKELGQLSIVDLIVSILIAELIAVGIESKHSIFISIVPIIVLAGVQMLVSYLTIKNEKIRNLVEGKPVIIIRDGKQGKEGHSWRMLPENLQPWTVRRRCGRSCHPCIIPSR